VDRAVGVTPAAGWYPDPDGREPLRWWDGRQWAPDVPAGKAVQGWSAWPASRHQLAQKGMREEESARPWARAGIWVIAFGQLVGALIGAWVFKPFWNQMSTVAHYVANPSKTGTLPVFPHIAPWATALQNLSALVDLGGLVAFAVWLHRAATHARGLGYPSARTPIWAYLGFIVPVVNLWFPYQVCVGCLPAGERATRRIVLRWWILYVVGGIGLAGLGIVAAFVPGVRFVLLVGGGAWAFAEALCGQAMVAAISTAHRASTADLVSV
jgi:hypothetical protein